MDVFLAGFQFLKHWFFMTWSGTFFLWEAFVDLEWFGVLSFIIYIRDIEVSDDLDIQMVVRLRD